MSLSIRQPWAEFIMQGVKTVENRLWQSTYRGVLLIHAAKKFDDDWLKKLPSMGAVLAANKIHSGMTIRSFGKINWQRGGIVGAVIMTGCDMVHNDPWCTYGCWYHRYRAVRRFKKMIACRGKQKMFNAGINLDSLAKEDRYALEELKEISGETCKFEKMI